jgi:hypothetical protein
MASLETSACAKEWELLLACASPESNPQKLKELLPRADFSALLTFADEHGVTGLLAARLRDLGPEDIPAEAQQQLREKRRTQMLVSLGMTAELLALLEKFKNAGIELLAIKGPTLSVQAYGDAGMRQFGDLDLLVRDRDIYLASEIMIAAGYAEDVSLAAIKAGKIPGEYVFHRRQNRMLVELHTEHTLRYFPRTVDIEGLFRRQIRVLIDAHEVPALSLEDELVMICVHGAKDLWERLLWIADVAGFIARQTKLSWTSALALTQELGATRILISGVGLASDLLQVSLPPEIEKSVRQDAAAVKLVKQIARWVPAAGNEPPGIFERALLRMRLRGGLIAGPLYLMRLSFSPTEDDWEEGKEGKRGNLLEALRRPFRLARKYGRDGKN